MAQLFKHVSLNGLNVSLIKKRFLRTNMVNYFVMHFHSSLLFDHQNAQVRRFFLIKLLCCGNYVMFILAKRVRDSSRRFIVCHVIFISVDCIYYRKEYNDILSLVSI